MGRYVTDKYGIPHWVSDADALYISSKDYLVSLAVDPPAVRPASLGLAPAKPSVPLQTPGLVPHHMRPFGF